MKQYEEISFKECEAQAQWQLADKIIQNTNSKNVQMKRVKLKFM